MRSPEPKIIIKNNILRLIGLLFAVVILVPAAAQETAPRERYAVVLFPVQSAVHLPPHPVNTPVFGRDKEFPYPGLLANPAIPPFDNTELERVLTDRPDLPHIDVYAHVHELVKRLDTNGDWSVDSVNVFPYRNKAHRGQDFRARIAGSTLEDENLAGVIFIDFQFNYAHQFDQIRVALEASVYKRRGSRVFRATRYPKRIEYLTPSIGTVLRPWRTGEKQRLVDAVTRLYESKVRRWPQDERRFGKDLKVALRKLEKEELLFPLAAVIERWDTPTLESFIREALDDLSPVVLDEFATLDFERPRRNNYVRFNYVARTGKHVRLEGEAFRESAGRVYYRIGNGDVYSLPTHATQEIP